MSTAEERNRALIWAGGFLIEIARDRRLPIALRQRAVSIARHFPTAELVAGSSRFLTSLEGMEPPADTHFDSTWLQGLEHGPLTESTRLAWPTDPEDQTTNQNASGGA
jgi:hypothetical protein